MAAPLRVTRRVLAAPLALLVALPYLLLIVAAAGFALRDGVAGAAWRDLWADPQTLRSLRLSVATAFGSSAVALAATLLLVTHVHGTPAWQRLTRTLGPMLSLVSSRRSPAGKRRPIGRPSTTRGAPR
jgi:ABC-type uncharacterized transport system YnjBCD permease subunit